MGTLLYLSIKHSFYSGPDCLMSSRIKGIRMTFNATNQVALSVILKLKILGLYICYIL